MFLKKVVSCEFGFDTLIQSDSMGVNLIFSISFKKLIIFGYNLIILLKNYNHSSCIINENNFIKNK
jgi:hypothetical protein